MSMGGHIWMNARKQDIADDDVWNELKQKMEIRVI